jgi:hypothetical protein
MRVPAPAAMIRAVRELTWLILGGGGRCGGRHRAWTGSRADEKKLRGEDSNLRCQDQNLECYRYTTPDRNFSLGARPLDGRKGDQSGSGALRETLPASVPGSLAGPPGPAMPSTRIAFRPSPSFSRPSVEVASWPQSSRARSSR